MSERDTSRVECKVCGSEYSSVGMYTHLRYAHDLSVDAYVQEHGEYRKKHLKRQKDRVQCLVCQEWMHSERALSFHVRKEHELTREEYTVRHHFDGEHPTCDCGCGEEVALRSTPPYRSRFVSGHNARGKNNPMYGRTHSDESKASMSEAAIDRIQETGDAMSEPERVFAEKFPDAEYQHKTDVGAVDFRMPSGLLVEVDGAFWHPERVRHLNFQQLASVVNDVRKDGKLDITRVRPSVLETVEREADLHKLSYVPDRTLRHTQEIVSQEYLRWYLQEKGEQALRDNAGVVLRFMREVVSDFPYPPAERSLGDVMGRISGYDFSRVDKEDAFRNNVWWIGNGLLKSRFRSYWHASFDGQPSPVDVWNDRNALRKVIEWRIGLNRSDEVHAVSLRNMLRGISARRSAVSFMKPLLAAAVYRRFLGSAEEPTVIDPCAGFGCRLLGFKALYPKGVYIGIEQNPETCKELRDLADELPGEARIMEGLQQGVDLSLDADLTFTCPPYKNTEVYSNGHRVSDWNLFMRRITRFPNLAMKVRTDLIDDHPPVRKWSLIKNSSHFGNSAEEVICAWF